MENIILKMRIAVLWIFMAVAMSAHSAFSFMDREVVEEMWDMEMGQGMLIFMALFYIIPLVMAFLTLTLKDKHNRWANIIVGGVFTFLNIFHLGEHIIVEPSAVQILIIGSTPVVTALVVWYAWKWPQEEEKEAEKEE